LTLRLSAATLGGMNKPNLAILGLSLLDLARFMLLVLGLLPLLAPDANLLTIRFLRLMAAPQLLLPASLFFLSLDSQRYAVYRPLNLLARLLGVLNCLFLVFTVSQTIRQAPLANSSRIFLILGLCLLADLAIAAILVLMKTSHEPSSRTDSRPSGAADSLEPDGAVETVNSGEAN